ncbi:MAG: transglycosylase SLT domain-containing protein [Deltaproteobacteria bacterium]|nr:transglycosylase SLT domain-containing protein [Deltaproteobacteria bacterium]
MKRKITTLIFCLTLLGASSAAVAETQGAPKDVLQGSLPALKVTENAGCFQGSPSLDEAEFALTEDDPYMCGGGEDNTFFLSTQAEPAIAACVVPDALDEEAVLAFDKCVNMAAAQADIEEAFAGNEVPDVPIVVNKNVEAFINYFQTRGRKYFEKWWGRSQDYMTLLQSILRENGLPEDLSYIAFIESGLNPTAKSHANAVGMWQFIRGTAKRYGLRVDWWIDERMDPEKATYAAAKYFKNLYDQFGSWYLAAAGYNAGEGKVARAVKKHNSEDFWVLASQKKPFRRETKEYVPKYLAALMIAKDPESYGFEPVDYNESMPYEKVTISRATDLRVIADAAGTSVEEIKRLNPELLRWFTPPNYPNYQVKIPAGTSEKFAVNMSKIPSTKMISFQMHKVRRGETVARIAKKYGTTVSPILYINNLKSAKYIKPGTIIAIPVRAGVAKAKGGRDVAEVLTHSGFQS